MTVDARVPPSGSRILYPNLPTPLTPTDLDRLFSPGYADRQWVLTVARTPRSQVAVLVQLLAFRAVGRFLTVEDIPASVVEYVAREFKVRANTAVRLTNSKYSARTWYRHQDVILAYLGVMAWGDQAQQLAESTMMKMAEARTDPADLINAAVDALVRHRFELRCAEISRFLLEHGLEDVILGNSKVERANALARHLLRNHSAEDIGRAAGGIGDDHLHRTRREFLRNSRHRATDQGHGREQCGQDKGE